MIYLLSEWDHACPEGGTAAKIMEGSSSEEQEDHEDSLTKNMTSVL